MNNNTTLEVCVHNISYNRSLHISNIVWHVAGLIGVIVGIPGHIFQIINLSNKANRKEPMSLYFIAIAICELIFLLGLFWLWCADMSFIKIDPRQVLSCGVFHTILIGSTTLSNLYLASMAIDTSIMILCPARYRLIVTRSRVILRIILISIIILLILIPHHFYTYYEPSTLFLCDFHSSVDHQQVRLWSLIHAILFVSIPSLIVCISTFILLYNRCKHKRIHKKNFSESARRVHRRSIFIFIFTVGIFLLVLPLCILEILIMHDRFFYHNRYCSTRWKIYKIVFNYFLTFLSINYSMKFYIHLIMSTTARRSFIQLITCRSNENISTLSRMNNGNFNELSLFPFIDRNKSKTEEM